MTDARDYYDIISGTSFEIGKEQAEPKKTWAKQITDWLCGNTQQKSESLSKRSFSTSSLTSLPTL